MDLYRLNKYQTPITEELQKSLPKEVWEDLIDFIGTIKFIQNLIAPEEVRGFAKDRPKDKSGKIIVDLTNPHILEDMDFFRERAIFFEKNKCYTHLRPNPNPRSEFAEFWREEQRRWVEGLIRPSDGEWIPGYYYFYLNYGRIWLNEKADEGNEKIKKKATREMKFPKIWLGDYLFFHYFDQAIENGKHAKILKCRGCGFSFKTASISPCNMYTRKGLPNFHLAIDKRYLDGKDGLFDKILINLDWLAQNTPWPRMRLIDKPSDYTVQLGNKDEYGNRQGYLSSVTCISLKDDPEKARGLRGPLIHYEEDGQFKDLESAWNVNRDSTEDGDLVFGTQFAGGCVCAGTKVWTNDGKYINIEDIKQEDGILGFDVENEKVAPQTISWMQPPTEKECVEIFTSNRNLRCSLDHPIFIDKKWIEAGNITPYIHKISIWENNQLIEEQVLSVNKIGKQKIYNLTAEENNTYLANNIITHNTSGLKAANFEGSEKLFRNPNAYNINGIPNVFDKNSDGSVECGFFWPAYLNRALCYDKASGEPDIIKALLEILRERFTIKYNSSDPLAITQRKAEKPITPAEATMRTSGTIFPVSDLKEYLADIKMQGVRFWDRHYVGDLVLDKENIKWQLADKYPIRSYQFTGNTDGAIEIFEMPKLGADKLPMKGRYIAGIDPYDDDSGTSLGSIFIFDMFFDTIVAEYTGRPKFANDFYETCKRMLLFYDARAMYENNKKGLFTYFSQQGCTYLLAENPKILKDQDMMRKGNYGNKQMGVHATAEINSYARRLQKDWMLTVAHSNYQDTDEQGNIITSKLNLQLIRSMGYLEELIAYNPDGNFDRCLLPGSKVLAEHAIINIEDLKLGDCVVTKDGNLNQIYKLHNSKYLGNIYNIRTVGNHASLGCTDNHPIFVKNVTKIHTSTVSPFHTYSLSETYIKRADELTSNDYLLIPTRKNKVSCNLSDELKYVLGWTLGDGYIINLENKKEYVVKIYFQEDQLNICEKIKEIVIKNFKEYHANNGRTYETSCKIDKEGGMYKLITHSKPFHEFCSYYLNTSPNKHMNSELFNSDKMLPFLIGYFEADGHYEISKNMDRRVLSVTSSNEFEIYQIRQMLLDENIWCTVSKSKGYLLTNGYMRNDAYTISINNNGANKIIGGSLKFEKKGLFKQKGVARSFQTDEGYWTKISSITTVAYDGPVYNISVINDPSYTANGITTHNCSAMGMTMILREEKKQFVDGIMNQNNPTKDIVNNDYFLRNYDNKYKNFSHTEIEKLTDRYFPKS